MVAPALHHGQSICFSCFTTRMVVLGCLVCAVRREFPGGAVLL
ncbi:MAG: hypothetical protein Q6373_011560 [Candidatus Sigynarchaeota archaeon]